MEIVSFLSEHSQLTSHLRRNSMLCLYERKKVIGLSEKGHDRILPVSIVRPSRDNTQ
jgi:hypothetical protein